MKLLWVEQEKPGIREPGTQTNDTGMDGKRYHKEQMQHEMLCRKIVMHGQGTAGPFPGSVRLPLALLGLFSSCFAVRCWLQRASLQQ